MQTMGLELLSKGRARHTPEQTPLPIRKRKVPGASERQTRNEQKHKNRKAPRRTFLES